MYNDIKLAQLLIIREEQVTLTEAGSSKLQTVHSLKIFIWRVSALLFRQNLCLHQENK